MTEERKNGQEAYVDALIARSRAAQRVVADYTQAQVDAIAKMYAKVVFDNSEMLARVAAEDSRMGVFEDKVKKCQAKSRIIWNSLRDKKTVGIIAEHPEEGIVEVAKPIGVIGCVAPTTNPTMTPNHNAMIALKGGNAIIVCPHPRAKETGIKTVELMRQALREIGYPEDLIQVVPEPTMEASGLIMQLCDACVSTGGPGMVKAAYSSGKPAFGVGAGNVQSLVDTDVDLEQAAEKIARSRTYDNGVLCTCEQCVHIPSAKFDAMVALLQAQGGAYIGSDADVAALRKAMFPNGSINKDVVGSTPQAIAALAGLTVPEEARFLLVRVTKGGRDEDLTKEKLCPVLAICPYDSWEGAVDLAVRNLKNEGAGHSTILHSNNKAHVEYAAVRLPVSRIGVNLVGSSGLGGGFDCGLNPTATLGCGTWGNNSISENLWWHHLVNISRIAYQMPNNPVPTDEEIWAE